MPQPVHVVDKDLAAAGMLRWMIPALLVASLASLVMFGLRLLEVLPAAPERGNDIWILILAMIPLGIWLSRVEQGARTKAGLPKADWDAGWGFIIPIANLWIPYLAVGRIWEISTARDPAADQRARNLRVLWWGCWLLMIVVGGYSQKMPWLRPWSHVAVAAFLGVSVVIVRQLTAARASSTAARP